MPVSHLSSSTWKWDFSSLPPAAKSAWLSHPQPSQLLRLTEDLFAFRQSSGSGVWTIGPLEDLLPFLLGLPIPSPYAPAPSPPAESDPLALAMLNITLD